MIKHNGYYLLDPVPFKDSVASYSFDGYNHKAYLFLENGTYIKSTKKSEDKEVIFSKGDFNRDYPNRYVIENNDLIITYHTGEKWEFSKTFKKESEDHYTNEGRSLKFVPWEPD